MKRLALTILSLICGAFVVPLLIDLWSRLAGSPVMRSPSESVRCDGGEEAEHPCEDVPLDTPATLESYPLPKWAEEWITRMGLK
jgi:hypothetical protein